jgi:ATP-binding cassette subfamily B multidrug efflux pump
MGGSANNSRHASNLLVEFITNEFRFLNFHEKIMAAGIVLVITAIVSGLFMYLMRQTIIVMSRHIEYDQKNDIFSHYQSLDSAFFRKNATGDLMNRISEDVSRVRMYTGPAIMYFVNLAAVIGFSIYFMVKSDMRLTIIALSPLPLLALTIYVVNTIIHRKGEKVQRLLSDLTTASQESYAGIRVIKSFVQETSMMRYFNEKSEEYRKSALSLAKTEAIYFPGMGLLIGLSTILTIFVAGMAVILQEPGASVGKIAEFVMYIQMLTFPVSAIGWTASMTQRAATSQKRINEFLQTGTFIKDTAASKDVTLNGDIELKDVSLVYENTGITAIRDFNLKIAKGEKIAIVGRTGSGKTSLAQLLLRMYDADKGDIFLDGIPIRDIRLHSLRSQISFVPQDVFLFSDSIRNNISFGCPEAVENEIREAAADAAIEEEILSFPAGFDTLVGERGVTLSGGQKQRISIARAVLKKPAIFILDDCLSAVDSKTEKKIAATLKSKLSGATTIIITHRVMPSFNFDRILVLDNGIIAEQGTHEELLARKGIYEELFNTQTSKDTEI